MRINRTKGLLAGLTAAGVFALGTPLASADTATLFSLNPLPTDVWGQDGTAYAVAISGNTVFAGGSFLHAVHGTDLPQRSNLMAVDRTGASLLPFAPTTDGTVRTMATDGASLYIGGDFTMVNGQPRNHLAKLNLDGSLQNFTHGAVNVPKTVRDLLVVGNTLYLVGDFGMVNGTVRKRAAAIDKTSGDLLPFNPNLGGKAYAVAAYGSTIYLGGNFLTVGGTTRNYLAAVDATSGALQSPIFKNVGDVILDLSVNTDNGSQVFGAGGGGFNSAAAWNTSDGTRQWVQRANGDVQAVKFAKKSGSSGVGNVYFGFHDGFGGNTKLRLLAADAASGTLMWATGVPVSGGNPGVVALASDGQNLVVGGRFPKMGTVKVKGLSIHP
jgi:Domain of unknown function (DUF5122) beta-propeller